MVKPSPGNILVRRLKPSDTIAPNILRTFIPMSGEIVAVADGEPIFKVGEKVVYNSKYSINVNDDNDKLQIVNICNILTYGE